MKITAQEEYGLRILIRIARSENGLCISEVSEQEGLSHHNTAKLCRVLRLGGFIESMRGNCGGYMLAKPANQVSLQEVLRTLGGTMYHENFCTKFSGELSICTNSPDCSLRSLWRILQAGIDKVLAGLTLADLTGNEEEVDSYLCSKDTKKEI